MALYSRSRGPCLVRAACCVPLQGCCFLVGVLPDSAFLQCVFAVRFCSAFFAHQFSFFGILVEHMCR